MEQSFLDQTRVFGKGQSFPIFINDKDFIVAQIDDSSFINGVECCFVGETAQIEIVLKDSQGLKNDGIFDNVELCYSSANRIVFSPDWNIFETLNLVFKVNFKAEKNVVYGLKKGGKEVCKSLLIQQDVKKITNFRMDKQDDARKFWNDHHFRELNKEATNASDLKPIIQVSLGYSFSPSMNLSDVLVIDENFKSTLKFVLSRSDGLSSISDVRQWMLEQFESFNQSHKDQGIFIRLNHGVPIKSNLLFYISVNDESLKDKKYLLIRLLTPRIFSWIRSMINDSNNYIVEDRVTCRSSRQFVFGESEIEHLLQKVCQKIQLLQCTADKKTFGLVVYGPEMSGRTTIGTLLLDRLTNQYIKVDMKSLLYNSRGLKFEDLKQEFEKKIAESLPKKKIAFLLENIEEMSVLGETDSSGSDKHMIMHYFKRFFKKCNQENNSLF